MHTAPQPGAKRDAAAPPPALTSVLADLGHDCPGTCAGATAELGAELWFVRRGPARAGRGAAALVVVDASEYDGSVERSRQLMSAINDCLRSDGIRLSERGIDDAGFALATVRPLPKGSVVRGSAATSLSLAGATS